MAGEANENEGRGKRYEKIKFLGEGQFAQVYKARDVQNDGRIVAVKKIKLGNRQEAKDGINRTALREIKLLQELYHPNIITLMDVYGQKSNISLVFDFMETDLEVIIKDMTVVLTPAHCKSYIVMTIKGLEYLHANWILHRDLKPNNLLVDRNGVLKIGDFGLAKTFGSPNRVYTHQVVTRWYRAPELLFGARIYGVGVDMFAVGCILAELLLRGVTRLPDYVQFKDFPVVPLSDIFTAAGDDLLEILASLLDVNPNARCTATEALKMPYFSNKPPPTPCHLLPMPDSVTSEIVKETDTRLGKRKMDMDNTGGLAKKLVF
ncbi:PREDICTED: cyclin-dependent kinase 7-like [Priapulus caudatus]|uniref:Cyclin-dependent kinase 7 n=1 Tax=Priapulus caudatus TaxID=37621 RepID=A0ABM1ELF0_PRICU|nr:PREDICTED: cyclin-dependent kinase 7-like [Priapulus caudatus]